MKELAGRSASHPVSFAIGKGVLRLHTGSLFVVFFDGPTMETAVSAEVTGLFRLPGRPSIINS